MINEETFKKIDAMARERYCKTEPPTLYNSTYGAYIKGATDFAERLDIDVSAVLQAVVKWQHKYPKEETWEQLRKAILNAIKLKP